MPIRDARSLGTGSQSAPVLFRQRFLDVAILDGMYFSTFNGRGAEP